MTIDIRAKSYTTAVKRLEKDHNKKWISFYRIPDTNIYRFTDYEDLPAKELDYKRVEKKFLVFNQK